MTAISGVKVTPFCSSRWRDEIEILGWSQFGTDEEAGGDHVDLFTLVGHELCGRCGALVPVVVDQADILTQLCFTVKHLQDIEDRRTVGPTHRVLLGKAAGGHDYHVRFLGQDLFGGHFRAELHGHAGLVHLWSFRCA